MKLQPASRQELARIAGGTLLCTAIMLAVFAVLSRFVAAVPFTVPVVLGGVLGAVVAIANFYVLCLTVQKAAALAQENPKRSRAVVQMSYNARLAVMAIWCVIAFAAPCFQVVAAVLPLLFPRVAIYALQAAGKTRGEPKAEAAARSAGAEGTGGPAEGGTAPAQPEPRADNAEKARTLNHEGSDLS